MLYIQLRKITKIIEIFADHITNSNFDILVHTTSFKKRSKRIISLPLVFLTHRETAAKRNCPNNRIAAAKYRQSARFSAIGASRRSEGRERMH